MLVLQIYSPVFIRDPGPWIWSTLKNVVMLNGHSRSLKMALFDRLRAR